MNISSENKEWLDDVYKRIIDKESAIARRSGEKIPYTTVNGVFDDIASLPIENPHESNGVFWWTNGFWPGMLWQMYIETKDEFYKDLANRLEDRMDAALEGFWGLHHDVGFMWLLTSVANFRLTGSEKSKTRAMVCANHLASRFNLNAGFLSAWNGSVTNWSIIDSMMNIPLLYWASDETGYARYSEVAVAHADKTMQNAVRPDGSVVHIVEYNPEDGSVVQTFGGQGFGVGSSWTRGQSWALYGFILSYIHTGEQRYIDTAKRVAHYYIAAIADNGYIPPSDFRRSATPVYTDTSSGACAACGLIEIAKNVGVNEKSMYLNAAVKILLAIDEKFADRSDSDALLLGGSGAYHDESHNLCLIYGDYYFMEAVFKLKRMVDGREDVLLW